MSTNKPDMIADIVADMRRRYDMMTDAIWAAPLYCSMDKTQAEADILNEFLGRLEAAMKCEAASRKGEVVDSKTETSNLARPCDTMGWRDAWAKWRTEIHPQKPETYGEAYDGTAAFMDWFTTPMKGE